MAKIHPKRSMISSCSENTSSKRETFTVWMKSLVINGNGCTVFNSEGKLVFRVDNYQTRRSREVLLMNFYGEVLYSIKKKRLLFFRSCEGHKWINSRLHKEGEWFKIKKEYKFFGRGKITCNVVLRCNKSNTIYKILGLRRKSTLKITDCEGRVLAEVVQKQSLGGFSLGDDVLSLMVEPQIDQSLVMALVIAYGMINNKL